MQSFKLSYSLFLRLGKITSRKLAEAAVGGHYDSDDGMFRDYFFRSYLSRLTEGQLFIRPWRVYHPFFPVFFISQHSGHHISYAVDQPYVKARSALRIDLNCFRRNKFWLCRSYGLSLSALRQFVHYPGFFVWIGHIGKYEDIHKSFYKA